MSRTLMGLIGMAWVLTAPQLATAHFVWLVRDAAEPATVKVYFSEVAEPDSPELLERIQAAEVWTASGRRSEPQALKLTKTDDALVAEIPPAGRQGAIALRHTYGVTTRGETSFLLNYYSKVYASPLPGTWQAVGDHERLPLEITPKLDGAEVALRVTWKGEPAKDASVAVHGPGGDREGATDEKGVFRCPMQEAGVYSIRARVIEQVEGERDGQKYQESRHYATLALDFAPARLSPVAHHLPELPQGSTSLGAAVAGDALYVYGGNYGDAHSYSRDDQSGDLWMLDLNKPAQWQKLPGGPKLQGLALVEHDGMLYRVGGFTAMNEEGADDDLHSQDTVARFDPQKRVWEDLPRLPEPRSSHDAAVLNGVLYVVGGWNMQGAGAEAKWHDTVHALDLKADQLEWKTVAAPAFKRRALAVAAWNGKLYCIGGMQERGGITSAVAVYDPTQDAWSEGSAILSGPMDGFGASAFACGKDLYVTTISGSVQRLAQDGSRWEFLGQLAHPRFFHRLVPWKDQLIVVGGGDMSVGKITEVEVIATSTKSGAE